VGELAHQHGGLRDGEPATDHDGGGARLVATWQRGNQDRGARCEQPQSNVRLNPGVEGFDEHEAATHPTLVTAKTRGDRALAHVMVAVQRAHDPRFFERCKATTGVQLAHLHGGVDDVEVRDDGTKTTNAESARRAQALEAVEHFDRSVTLERAHGRELSVLLERRAHRGERGGVGEAKRGEPLAEIDDGDEALKAGSSGHGAQATTSGLPRSMRVGDVVPANDGSAAVFRGFERGR
jgi:hypothetical protein